MEQVARKLVEMLVRPSRMRQQWATVAMAARVVSVAVLVLQGQVPMPVAPVAPVVTQAMQEIRAKAWLRQEALVEEEPPVLARMVERQRSMGPEPE